MKLEFANAGFWALGSDLASRSRPVAPGVCVQQGVTSDLPQGHRPQTLRSLFGRLMHGDEGYSCPRGKEASSASSSSILLEV